MTANSWLYLIDLQPVFSDPASLWHTPGTRALYPGLEKLAAGFGDRVLCSRFVPPAKITGSWAPYYRDWPFAPAADPAIWELDAPWKGRAEISSHMFSKWTPEAEAILGSADEVWLAGVTTDCCVLNTAMQAMDHGAQIRLISDGCAAATDEIHQNALSVMALRAPQIRLSTLEDALADL